MARGIYEPNETGASFTVYRGIPIYGNFAGTETFLAQRNLNDPNNQSIIRSPLYGTNYIVAISNRDASNVLDGFTMRWAYMAGVRLEDANLYIANCLLAENYYGIESYDSNFMVSNCNIANIDSVGISASNSNFMVFDCNITNSISDGISASDSNFTVSDCVIANVNGGDGIYTYDSNFSVFDCNIHNNGNDGIYTSYSHFTVAGSVIQDNGQNGIVADLQYTPVDCKTMVKNNIIRNNSTGVLLSIYYSPVDANILNNLIYNNNTGIDFFTNSGHNDDAIIQNNTIVKNSSSGIETSGSWYRPIIRNCILWGNSPQLSYNVSPTYSCIEDGSIQFPDHNNIYTNPSFVDYDNNDFHLQYASLCIDAGDPCANYSGQTDIDRHPRVMLGNSQMRVDIGADEFLKADFNGDGIVNFIDYSYLAAVWKSSNSPSISLDSDNDVDIDDLKIFCNEWLWYSTFFPLNEMLAEQLERDSGMIAGTELIGQSSSAETLELSVDNTAVVPEGAIEEIIDWLEVIWETDPEVQEVMDPNNYQRFIDSLREELNN